MAEKIGYLDGLRGVAALVVVFCHFVLSFYPSMMYGDPATQHIGQIEWFLSTTPLNIFYNGSFAVSVFFVLSGYVLTRNFFIKEDRKLLVSGVVRRYFRLLPVVVVSILVVFLFLTFSWFSDAEVRPISHGSLLCTTSTVFPVFLDAVWQAVYGVFIVGTSTYNGVLWTMQIEFFGSLLVFAFAMFFGNMKNRWIFYIMVIIVFWDSHYLAFILGLLLSDMYNRNVARYSFNNKYILFGLLCIGLLLGSYNHEGAEGNNIYTNFFPIIGTVNSSAILYHIIGAFIVLFVLLNSDTLKSIFGGRVPVFLGRISFSMYAFHQIILFSFSCLLFLKLYEVLPYNSAMLIVFIASMIMVLICSYAVCRCVDEPGIRLSKYIDEKVFSERSKPVDWRSIGNRITWFASKNVLLLVIIEVILIVFIGSMVFVVKPGIEHTNVDKTKVLYYEWHNQVIYSYQNLSTYGQFNGTTIGAYNIWVDGYHSNSKNFSKNYENMKYFGTLYLPYSNGTEHQNIESEIQYYGGLVNETEEMSKLHSRAYDDWYWNNTLPRV